MAASMVKMLASPPLVTYILLPLITSSLRASSPIAFVFMFAMWLPASDSVAANAAISSPRASERQVGIPELFGREIIQSPEAEPGMQPDRGRRAAVEKSQLLDGPARRLQREAGPAVGAADRQAEKAELGGFFQHDLRDLRVTVDFERLDVCGGESADGFQPACPRSRFHRRLSRGR